MFSKLVALSGALAVSNADMDMYSSTEMGDDAVNFFVDTFEDGAAFYPYPLGICVQTALLSATYAMYQCNQEGTKVLRTTYSDSECTTMTAQDAFDSTDITEDGVYDFECNGVNSYSSLFLCVGSDTCTGCLLGYEATIYASMFTCTYGGSNATVYTTCDDSATSLTAYPKSDTCSEVEGQNSTVLAATEECQFFYAITDPFAVSMYAQALDCMVDVDIDIYTTYTFPEEETTQTPTGDDDDDDDDDDSSSGDDDDDDDDSAMKFNSIIASVFTIVIGYLFM